MKCLACEKPLTRKQFKDSDYCPECDGHYSDVWCNVCKKRYVTDFDMCIHLVWDNENGLWIGCGGGDIDSRSFDFYQKAFDALLGRKLCAAVDKFHKCETDDMPEKGKLYSCDWMVLDYLRDKLGI